MSALKAHLKAPIPVFYLAAWLFRERDLDSGTKPSTIIDRFLKEFHISSEEKKHLFDTKVPDEALESFLQSSPVEWPNLKNLIGPPPDARPDEGAALLSLHLQHVGPSPEFRYEPGSRLNIITGDNSLGKTFLLECIWWALTGQWIDDNQAAPRRDAAKSSTAIAFDVAAVGSAPEHFESKFNWDRQSWPVPPKRSARAGLVVHARFDGSFAVWDPARMEPDDHADAQKSIFFRADDVWDGLRVHRTGPRQDWISNGLIIDWVNWQRGGIQYVDRYAAFVACLRALSPSPTEPLSPGDPTRIAGDSRDMPTLRMPYGEIPVRHASAGVRRVVALSYVLVWAWHEHLTAVHLARQSGPPRHIVLLLDEAEAHLHPRWQRVIVPALMNVVGQLTSETAVQVHLATHSPMVVASAETIFDSRTDELHHLKIDGSSVVLEKLDFVRRGDVNRWLISEVFGLKEPRSIDAELALSRAEHLMRTNGASESEFLIVQNALQRSLPDVDAFWVRWRFWAQQQGMHS